MKKTSASKVVTPLRKKKANQPDQSPAPDQNANTFKERLGKVGSIGKKTDKTNQQKAPKRKARPSVSFVGGLQDAGRFRWIWALMVIGFGALFARAFYLQIINADFYIKQGDKLITAKQTLPTYRGMILDTNGAVLAANAPLSNVIFSPYDYAQAYYEAKRLEKTARSDVGRQNAKETLLKMDLNLLAVASNVPRETLEKAVKIDETVDVTNKEAVEGVLPRGAGSKRMILLNKVSPEIAETVTSLRFKGVSEEKHQQRFYLQPEPTAQILGYMAQSSQDEDGYVGRSGIEAKYEKQLAGENGQILTLRSVRSAIGEIKELKPKVAGENVQLTIDSRLQYILYKELAELGRRQSAKTSSGIIVDVMTGDVLAMSSWPSFNSNNLSDRTNENERNRAVLDVFEPGSVMKPFTVISALESGKYNVNTLINTSPGSMKLGKYSIHDSGNYGSITLAKLLQKSSNVASAKIALALPADAIAKTQQRFGFGKKTMLDFPAEASGRVDIPTSRDVTRRATLAYGYGQQVTLAQIAQAYATLGNGGVMRPLRLIKSESTPEPVEIVSQKHAQNVVNMMISVTEQGGTAMEASINGYHVAGKTGTSRLTNKSGGYYKDKYRNVFAGIAPASNPRFVVAIVVEDPKRAKYAGQTAAPVFANVMKETLRLYNVPYDKPLDLSKD